MRVAYTLVFFLALSRSSSPKEDYLYDYVEEFAKALANLGK